jgi:hypothetical protein
MGFKIIELILKFLNNIFLSAVNPIFSIPEVFDGVGHLIATNLLP